MTQKKTATAKTTAAEAQNDLIDELKNVVAQAQEILESTADDQLEKAEIIREKLGDALRELNAGVEQATQQARSGLEAAEDRIRDNPLAAVGVAAGIGVLIGLMLNRGR